MTIPSSRSDWAKLDWQEAQQAVAHLLNINGYMTFEEKKLSRHSRSDVVVIRILPDQVIFGIIEVKCYQKVTRGLQKQATEQAFRYLRALFEDTYRNQRWEGKVKSYFIAVVFTNDYPASFFSPSPEQYRTVLQKDLTSLNPTIILTTPDSLIRKLGNYFPIYYRQSNITDFL